MPWLEDTGRSLQGEDAGAMSERPLPLQSAEVALQVSLTVGVAMIQK